VIQVLQPGMSTTVQDLGREGFGPMGISPSGAADAVSLRLGNLLVGNLPRAAGLEMTLLGGTFLFPEGATVVLAGSDFGATLDGVRVGMRNAVEVRPGQTLQVGATRGGARCCLCVRGGIAVETFLGSASTHVLSGLGGFKGRALQKGDVLAVGKQGRRAKSKSLSGAALAMLAPRKSLRVTPGPQRDWFDDAAKKLFERSVYRVTEEANRVGLRLAGPAIKRTHGGELVSEGVALGAVQIPESGQPIILFVEQQTAGGYPKIANVISADFHSLGQLRPRDEMRFEMVSFETARKLFIEQETLLASGELFA
jgi:antagonist of KipI